MALDTLGTGGALGRPAPITTDGPSGTGFVNFGVLRKLDGQAPIETRGTPSAGCSGCGSTPR